MLGAMMSLALLVHVLAAIAWVGGMLFAYACLRPVAASLLEAPVRQRLWVQVFKRFFVFVWLAVLLLPSTGLFLAVRMFGSIGRAPIHVHLMLGGGLVMILVFLHLYLAPYRRLRRTVASQDYELGGAHLAQIRKLVGINTILGLLVAAVASGGRLLGY